MNLFWKLEAKVIDHFTPIIDNLKRRAVEAFDRYLPVFQLLVGIYLVLLMCGAFAYYIATGDAVFGFTALALAALGAISGGVLFVTQPDY